MEVDEDGYFEDIKKRGKGREMSDINGGRDIERHQEEGKGERNE